MRASTRRGYRDIIEGDLEIMPLMNLFVAMIPMLLISAVFLNVTVIDMKAPPEASGNKAAKSENLALAITIKDNYFVVEGRQIQRHVIDRSKDDADVELADVLTGIVAEHPGNQDVMIISQPKTNYGDIIAVMDISRESGLPGVSLLGVE